MFFSFAKCEKGVRNVAYRAYVRVLLEVDEGGGAKPMRIYWADGRCFDVDRLEDVRRAPASRTGGQGLRYTCRVHGRQVYLYEDGGRWFVEAKDAQRQEL